MDIPGVGPFILKSGPEGLSLLASVAADVDDHIGRALAFVHERLLAEPDFFGLTSWDLTVDDLPLDTPQLNFYVGDEWILHFQRGGLPICEPYGLAVVFEGHDPVRIDDLTDSESVD